MAAGNAGESGLGQASVPRAHDKVVEGELLEMEGRERVVGDEGRERIVGDGGEKGVRL